MFCANKNINQLVTTVLTVIDKRCTWFAVKNKYPLMLRKQVICCLVEKTLSAHVNITISDINNERVQAKCLGVL